jgi:hypothetical protein
VSETGVNPARLALIVDPDPLARAATAFFMSDHGWDVDLSDTLPPAPRGFYGAIIADIPNAEAIAATIRFARTVGADLLVLVSPRMDLCPASLPGGVSLIRKPAHPATLRSWVRSVSPSM